MTITWILSAALFGLAMTASPGPNNMMLASSGANFGVGRSVPHILGISIGIATVQFAMALLGDALLGNAMVRQTLTWVGVAYILYLAYRIAITSPRPDTGKATEPLGFVRAALFQWVNPKVWVAAGSAVVTFAASAEGLGTGTAMAVLALVFAIIAIPSSTAWACIGATAGRLLRSDRALRTFNLVMAALLVASLIPVLRH